MESVHRLRLQVVTANQLTFPHDASAWGANGESGTVSLICSFHSGVLEYWGGPMTDTRAGPESVCRPLIEASGTRIRITGAAAGEVQGALSATRC